jgi:hypothetical protein
MSLRKPKPADDSEKTGRIAQLRAVWSMTSQLDPRLLLYVAGPAALVLVVLVVLGIVLGHPVYFSILGVAGALMVATIIFGRRASAAMFAQVEGKPGAAAAVLQSMRGDWRVEPAVQFTRDQDLVHRIIGRPGVVLIGEGSPSRVRQLIAQERKRVARVAADVPTYDVQVGDEEGQIPLRKLQRHLMKLPRNLKGDQVAAVEGRMRALGGPNVPIPKGPLPRGGRIPRGKMR